MRLEQELKEVKVLAKWICAGKAFWEKEGLRWSLKEEACLMLNTFWTVCWLTVHLTRVKSKDTNTHSVLHRSHLCLVTQSCPTLCDPMDYSPPGSSVHGISQARILEWVAISISKGSSLPRDRTWVSFSGRFFANWATREASISLFSVSVNLFLF